MDEMDVSGVASLLAFFAAIYLLHWQIRVRPHDGQQRAAFVFVLMTAIVTAQLSLAYLGGPSFGAAHRGVASFSLWALSIAWLAWETRKMNLAIIEERRRALEG